jgi:nicotinate-nucleotide pyrophosphorylase (carboxylating)
LRDDLARAGDITSKAVLVGKLNLQVTASVAVKETGVIAGLEEVSWFYRQYGISVSTTMKDGDNIKSGDIVLKLEGKLKKILMTERVGMNIVQRMSGIATQASFLVKRAYPVLIAGTRKTLWGAIDNKAVRVGGGVTHRLGLWDAILIKDNHLALVGIETSIQRAWEARDSAAFIEIEVGSTKQAVECAVIFKKLIEKSESVKPCVIMLDNFSPKEATSTVSELIKLKLHSLVVVESSGGITGENIDNYVKTGVDVVSLGALTHSSKALDLSLNIKYDQK